MFALTAMLGSSLPPSLSTIILVATMYGIFQGSYKTLSRAVISYLSSPAIRGTAYGMLYLTIGVGTLMANSIMGWLWFFFGYQIALTYSGTISTISAILLLSLRHGK